MKTIFEKFLEHKGIELKEFQRFILGDEFEKNTTKELVYSCYLDYYKLTNEDVRRLWGTRKKEVIDLRRKCWAVLDIRTTMTYTLMGFAYNNDIRYFDHTTVLHSMRKHEDFMDTDRVYRKEFEEIMEMVDRFREIY